MIYFILIQYVGNVPLEIMRSLEESECEEFLNSKQGYETLDFEIVECRA